jgi:YD repeat-containing protein
MLTFQPLSKPVKNMTYDNNGNMTSVTNGCGTTTYTWDVRNRLIGINGYDTLCAMLSASFKYDALGRRIQKTITHTDTGTVTDTM